MSYFLICNCIAAVFINVLICKKIIRIAKAKIKSVEKILFANVSSGCCASESMVDSCRNRHCFQKNLNEIVELIARSKHSVCLALYTFNLKCVYEALKSACDRGVKIKIIISEESMKSKSRDLTQLLTLSGT